MDSSIQLRKKIHDFIDQADDKTLQIFNAIISNENSDEKGLTKEHREILDKRLEEHQYNPESGKPWTDVVNELKKEYGL
ncbi:addiction module protein [Epilithonimonas sp.]|uniref:addiction module protein n=1 Tax=Epilithonimonas sp. TaxID=2894511 RepID=UPI0028A04975|nr:addiction module protein [Epilithonimonas sp.]